MSFRIMIPKFKVPSEGIVYFKGFINTSDQTETVIYITEYLDKENNFLKDDNIDIIYGCCCCAYHHRPKYKSRNFLYLAQTKFGLNQGGPVFSIQKLLIGGKIMSTDKCIIMLYDYNSIKNSESIVPNSYLSKLQSLITGEDLERKESSEKYLKSPCWLSASMFGQHLLNYINLIIWFLCALKRNKKMSVKCGNLLLAILADLSIGYCILQLMVHEKELSQILMGVLEKLVNLLYSLLKWLMGAPAGLKLNNAFNKMLGQYFSYHIQLWWLFLDVSGEKLDVVLHLYRYVGYLGFTFQAALISDLLCIASFHSYCIYVYAARLFNIQISGLVALMRLFVGRKFNPLRGGIDSCEYTNQELFVGTVAFTILLLLLPTTALYYTVFTMFRLLSLLVQYSLAKLIYITQTLPLYVVTLWLGRSSKIAGNISIEMINNDERTPTVLNVKLHNKSLGELMIFFRPPVETPKPYDWTNVLSNIIVGKQII